MNFKKRNTLEYRTGVDFKLLNIIISKIEQYYYQDNLINFHGKYSSYDFHEDLYKGSMLSDFQRRLYEALVFHKEFQTYSARRAKLWDKLCGYSEIK